MHHSQTRHHVLKPDANFLLKKKNPKEISFAGFEFEILIKKSHVFKKHLQHPNWKKKRSLLDTKYKPLEVDLVEATELSCM